MTKEVIKFRNVPKVGGGGAADSASTVLHKPQDQIRVCEPLPSVLEFRVQCAKVGLDSQGDKLLPNSAGAPLQHLLLPRLCLREDGLSLLLLVEGRGLLSCIKQLKGSAAPQTSQCFHGLLRDRKGYQSE